MSTKTTDEFETEMERFKRNVKFVLYGMAGVFLCGIFALLRASNTNAARIYTVRHDGNTYEADNVAFSRRSNVVHFRDRATGKRMSIEGKYVVTEK